MSIKIKISYTTDEELAGVIRLLSPVMKFYRVSGKKKGQFQNAYVDINAENLKKLNLKWVLRKF